MSRRSNYVATGHTDAGEVFAHEVTMFRVDEIAAEKDARQRAKRSPMNAVFALGFVLALVGVVQAPEFDGLDLAAAVLLLVGFGIGLLRMEAGGDQ